jgi:hypothetical protein
MKRGRLRACAPWALLALGACHERHSAPAEPPAHSAPPAASLSAPPPAPVAAPTLTLPPSEPASAGLDEASFERRTFRQTVVGGIVYPPERLTWVFFRSATRVRLQLFCQKGALSGGRFWIGLDGRESDEATWGAPIRTEYAGQRVSEKPLSYRLAAASGPVGETACEKVPSVLLLACSPGRVSVLHAGARLVVGQKGPDDLVPWHWQPGTSESIAATRCELSEEGQTDPMVTPFRTLWRDWPLVFAAPRGGAPGIEWAHENSDSVVQEGAYRWMATPP